MTNKSSIDINNEWKNGRLPIINGILYHDGSIDWINIDYDNTKRKIEYGSRININELLSEDDFGFSYIGVNDRTKDVNNSLNVCCGEGGFGGDGFVVVESTANDEIIWVAFFETANPFIKVEVTGDTVYAINNLGEKWCFNIYRPKEIHIVYPIVE
jgi:hypothetical protein